MYEYEYLSLSTSTGTSYPKHYIPVHIPNYFSITCKSNCTGNNGPHISVFSYGPSWQYVIIGSNADLAPNWWQAIAWGNDDQHFVTIYRSLCISELRYLWACRSVEEIQSWCPEAQCSEHTNGTCGSACLNAPSLDKGVYHTDVNINCHAKNVIKYIDINIFSQ